MKSVVLTGRSIGAVAVLLSLALATHIVATTYITSYSASDWGMVSRLPGTFWLGLLLTQVLVYIGRKSTTILGIALALVFLYLYVIPTVVNEHGVEFDLSSYFSYGESLLLTRNGHLMTEPTTSLIRYHNWPGFLYFGAILSQATGVSSFGIPHYFPILNAGLLGLFAFIILRIGLEMNLALLGTMWVLASNFQPHLAFFPQGMGIVLALPFFFLLAKQHFSHVPLATPFRLLRVLLFVALTITHSFTSLATLVAIGLIFVLGRLVRARESHEFSRVALLAVIFAGYTVYATSGVFAIGVRTVYATILGQTTGPVGHSLRFGSDASQYYNWTIALNYIIVAFSAITGSLAIIRGLLRPKNERANHIFWIGWAGGLVVAGTFAYEGEGYMRAFSLGLIPVAYLCTKLLATKRNLLVAALILLVAMNIPAHYGNMTGMQRYVTTPELAGKAAYAQYTPADATYFYQGYTQAWADDPVRSQSPGLTFVIQALDPKRRSGIFGRENEPPVDVIRREATYVIDSEQQREYFKYFTRYDFFERLNADSWADRWYDNGFLRIYENGRTY